MTIRQAFNNWLAYHASAIVPTTAASRRHSQERFFEWCEEHAVSFESIDRSHIAAFMRWCQEYELKNSTIMMRVKELRSFFEWCVEERLLPINPVQLKHLPKLRTEKSNKVPFNEADFHRAMAEARQGAFENRYEEFWPDAMTIAYHTGARISDVACCRWENVDLQTDVFVIYPRKKAAVKERLEIPMVPDLRACLLKLWSMREDEAGYVLPAMAITYLGARSKLEGEFRIICDAAGLTEHSFHSYRHGFVSRLVNAGVSPSVVSKMTGQTLETIHGYLHLSMDAKRQALMSAIQPERKTAI